MIALFYFALLAIASRIAMGSFQCSTFDSNMGATYELTDLYRYRPSFVIPLKSTIVWLWYVFFRSPDQPPYQVTDGDIPCTLNKVHTLKRWYYLQFDKMIILFRLSKITLTSLMFVDQLPIKFHQDVETSHTQVLSKLIEEGQLRRTMIGAILQESMRRVVLSFLY